jgi:hypothetical protein
MGAYHHHINTELFLFCLENGNEFFLRRALRLRAFDKMVFREEVVKRKLLDLLE